MHPLEGGELDVLRTTPGPASALLHGPEQIADLPVSVAESPGAVCIGHPERSQLVEYLVPRVGVQLVASPTDELAYSGPMIAL